MRASYAVRAIGAVTIPAVTLPLAAASVSASVLPAAATVKIPPPPSKALPAALDIAEPYVGQSTCDPTAKPYVVKFGDLLKSHYASVTTTSYGIGRNCNSGVTEHSEGRALDWMLSVNDPTQKAVADSVTQWLSAPDAQGRPGAMARRFGIMYIIWNRKMWRAYDPGRGWAPYTGSAPHTDHIHFSFSWDGAYGRTSWWTGKALTVAGTRSGAPLSTTPSTPTTPATGQGTVYGVLSQGATGPDVALAQKALKVTADGIFGPKTLAALTAWQKAQKLPVTGVLDAATWTRMIALKLVPARPVASSPVPPSSEGSPATGGSTSAPGTGGSTSSPSNVRVPLVRAVVDPSAATAYTPYLGTVLRTGARGDAVKALQRALGGVAVDGAYGARTASAVSTFQKSVRLKATGVADPAVWKALETRDYPFKAYYGRVLRLGSTGPAVTALQQALRIPATGSYDLSVVSAVKALQGRAKLARTGSVATLTWQALEAELRSR